MGGKTKEQLLEELSEVQKMLEERRIAQQSATQPDRFHKAIIFPVPADDADITQGVIVFMS